MARNTGRRGSSFTAAAPTAPAPSADKTTGPRQHAEAPTAAITDAARVFIPTLSSRLQSPDTPVHRAPLSDLHCPMCAHTLGDNATACFEIPRAPSALPEAPTAWFAG